MLRREPIIQLYDFQNISQIKSN